MEASPWCRCSVHVLELAGDGEIYPTCLEPVVHAVVSVVSVVDTMKDRLHTLHFSAKFRSLNATCLDFSRSGLLLKASVGKLCPFGPSGTSGVIAAVEAPLEDGKLEMRS